MTRRFRRHRGTAGRGQRLISGIDTQHQIPEEVQAEKPVHGQYGEHAVVVSFCLCSKRDRITSPTTTSLDPVLSSRGPNRWILAE